MATGTISSVRDSSRSLRTTILGVTQASTSPVFKSWGYPIGSFTVQGTFQTASAATVQLQGSNDGGTTWFNLLSAGITSAGTVFTGALVGTNNEVFQLYQFSVASGDAGTNLNFYVFQAATFG